MNDFFETLIVRASQWMRQRPGQVALGDALVIGNDVTNTRRGTLAVSIPTRKRAEHLAILGKTGMGKSSLLKWFIQQDIRANRGLIHFDLHGDTFPDILRVLADEEQRRGIDLSDRVLIIEPADTEYAVGINVLDATSSSNAFTQVSEVTQLLKQRWGLDGLGPRTEELLRNALLVLTDARQTLLELAPLLTSAAFRTSCLQRTQNAEARAYFEDRYDAGSEAMRHAWRDAVLNKVSTFTADPHFRHMLGQTTSTFSLVDVLDGGCIVLLNLDKGRLGEQALTLGALFLSMVKHALFARRSRALVTVYLDEVQNFVAADNGIDTLLSEARKYSVGLALSTQVLDAYTAPIRAAVMGVGTQIAFQLSSLDADRMASALGGGHHLQTLLKALPPRHVVVRSGHHAWRHAVVPGLQLPVGNSRSLYERSRARWARRRRDVETDIQHRHAGASDVRKEEALREWD